MLNIVIIGHNEFDSILSMYSSLKKYFPRAKRIWILDRCTDNSKKLLKLLKEEYHTKTIFSNGFGRKTSTNRNYGLSFCDEKADVLFLDGDRYIKLGNVNKLKDCKSDVILFKTIGDHRVENYSSYSGRISNCFYSCGVLFKRDAINKIIDFQGELFCTKVEKNWGSEDLYLGDVCHHLKLKIDFFEDCRLNGKFEKRLPEKYDSLKKRFELRSKLNVLWY